MAGALKLIHEKFQKTDEYPRFLEQFKDAVATNENLEAHVKKVCLSTAPCDRPVNSYRQSVRI